MAILPNVSMTNWAVDSSSGWGTDEYGVAWSHYTPTGSTRVYKSGGLGRIQAVAGHGNIFSRLNVPDRSDYEVLTLSEHDINTLQSHGPMIGMSTSTRGYGLRMTGQRVSIIALNGSGTITEMNGVQISTQQSANRKIWMRLKYDAGAKQIRGKWWYQGTAEPSAWSISSYVGTYPITGKVGYYARDIGSYGFTVKVHAFYVLRSGASRKTSLPHTDNFNRYRPHGLGRSDSGHVWLGHANFDPDYYAQTSGNIYNQNPDARIDASGGQERILLTDSPAKNARIRSSFSVSGSNASPIVYFGLRASNGVSNGSLTVAGYELRVVMGSAIVIINKRTSLNGPVTEVGRFNAGFTFAKGTKYVVDFQANGTQLAAKVWRASSSEPQYHNFSKSDSSIGISGRQYVRAHPNGSSTMNFKFDSITATTVTTVTLEPVVPPAPPPDPAVNQTTTGSVTASSITDSSVTLKATFTKDDNNNATVTFQYKPRSSSTWESASLSSSQYTRTGTTKSGQRTISGLDPNTVYDIRAVYSDSNGVKGTNPRTTSFTTRYDGVRPTTLTVSSKETTMTVRASYLGDNNNNSVARCTVKSGSNTPINNVAMVAARTQKFFELDVSGLQPDTQYTVTVTFSDGTAVYGTVTLSQLSRTLGAAVELESVSVRTTMTTAIITTKYLFDENNNSEVDIQYRRKGVSLWTTVNSSSISVNRSDKTFIATITGLTMNVGYDLQVTIRDDDGVSSSSPTTVTRSFSTSGVRTQADRSGKQNVYRVYDPDGKFVGSWGDGPEPVFSLDENGGVTNLSVTLPRTFSQIENDKTIAFMNRVDVWCIDGEAQGMGRNLITDPSFDRGSWTIPSPWERVNNVGADGLWGLRLNNKTTTLNVMGESVELPYVVPLVLTAHARAVRGKLRIDIEAFDANGQPISVSEDNAETVGTGWQKVLLEWLPPPNTKTVRVRVESAGQTTGYVSHVSLLAKEMLIYRGTIEAFEPQLDPEGERVQIDILGLTSYLTDAYIDFMQWVNIQPTKDIVAKRVKKSPTDPANMIKDVIDWARKDNPKFPIYYTSESIKMTGEILSYTIRDSLVRDALDKIRSISPPNWHWFVDQTGCLHFRGPEHVTTHRLTIGVEIMEYRNPQTVRNLKNHIRFTGRQDDDASEPDGYGTIRAEVMDTKSIARFGKRTANFRDANITDPDTAMMYANGKLEELGQPEEAGVVKIPDEKDTRLSMTSLRGFNVQAFMPGDLVEVRDPENGPYKTYWDQFNWDEGVWDTTVSKVVSLAVPIKVVAYKGDHVILSLSHRRPSANGDFARMAQRLRTLEAKEANGDY